MVWYQKLRAPKARDEASVIVQAFDARGTDIAGVRTVDGWIEFMYAEGQLLARRQDVDDIQEVLGERARATVAKRVIKDIVLLQISYSDEFAAEYAESDEPEAESDESGADRDDSDRFWAPLLRLLTDIDEALGPGIATLNHVVTAAGNPSGCPATEAEEVYDATPFPPLCVSKAGEGVRIYVADTGIVTDTVTSTRCDWLAGVTGDEDPSVSGGAIQPYGAHGTFVAGVIRAMAPRAEIDVRCVFDVAGSALESDFVPKLYAGFGFGADIFHITVASQTRCNLPLIAFEAWLQDLRQHKGVACLLPAGNNASWQPCWPAAFAGVISVGALATDWRRRAHFSNYGGWVDVYAPGQNLVNAFATGTLTCQVAPFAGQERTFSGMAQWSGTSFSTPIVTGLIAARMTRCGESAREAAEALLAKARAQAIPGVGPALFPGCEDDEGHRGRCDGERGCGCGGGCRGGGSCGCGGSCACGGGRGGGHRRHGLMPR